MNEKEKETLKSWQVGDLLLYNHFQQIFKQKIIDYGDTKMKEDINILQELNKEAKERCVISETDREHMDRKSLYRYLNLTVEFKLHSERVSL